MKEEQMEFKISQWYMRNNIELSPEEISVLIAVSTQNVPTQQDDCLKTMVMGIQTIRASLGIVDDAGKRGTKIVAKAFNSLVEKGVLQVNKINKEFFTVTQPLVENDGELFNYFKLINYNEFQKLASMESKILNKMKLISCYFSITSKIFPIRKFKEANQKYISVNELSRIVNFSTVAEVGKFYGASENTARKHIQKLKEMGLVVVGKGYDKGYHVKNYYTIPKYRAHLNQYLFMIKSSGTISNYEISE